MSKKALSKNDSTELSANDIEYLFFHITMLWRRLINTKIKALGLGVSSAEKSVLFCVARHPGLTQVQVANMLELEPQNLIRLLDRLEKQNLIIKQNDPNDRRVKCLYITPQAKTIITKIRALSNHVRPEVLAGMDAKKVDVLVKQLLQMRQNLLEETGSD